MRARRSGQQPPPIRHGGDRRQGASPVGHAIRVLAIVTTVLTVSSLSIASIVAWQLTDRLQQRSVDIGNGARSSPAPPAAFSGAFNVLMVGVDNSAAQSGFGSARQATLNDVNILVHVAADHRSGVVLSLPRDLVLDQPRCVDPTSRQVYPAVTAEPLNTAFARGGLGCVVATVQRQTELQIPYAALFTFQGTVAMADAIGGVTVCATKPINDPQSGLKLPAGRSVITGRTALAYLRTRHGVGDGSDLGRIGSQQAYMSSALRKMTSSATLTSPARLYALATAAAQNVTLSKSLADPGTIVTMMLAIKQVPLSRLALVQYPTQTDPQNVNKVVPDPELARVLLTRIRHSEAIPLGTSNLGISTALTRAKPRPTASAQPTTASSGTTAPSTDPAIPGLKGQTADEQTCSVAATG